MPDDNITCVTINDMRTTIHPNISVSSIAFFLNASNTSTTSLHSTSHMTCFSGIVLQGLYKVLQGFFGGVHALASTEPLAHKLEHLSPTQHHLTHD